MKSSQAYTERSDEELMALVKAGDPQAFRELYARYRVRILSYCLRLMRSREAAQDCFQVVFTNLFEKRQRFDGPSFSAWIYGIARNACLKALALNSREQEHRAALDIEEIMQIPEEIAEIQDYQDLLRAIEQLPPEFREPVQLRYYDHLSYNEIAEVLNIQLSLVKVRIFRAKKMLKEILTRSQEHHEPR